MENIVEIIITRNVEARREALLPFEYANMTDETKERYGSGQDQHTLTPYEIADFFPGIEKPLRKRRATIAKEAKSAAKDADRELSESTEAIYMAEGIDTDLMAAIADDTCTQRKKRYDRELKRMDKILGIFAGRRMSEEDPDRITDADVAQAKERPIEDFVEVRRRDRFMSCPFHNEKTPSCKVFKDNHYHCFGCGEHGDVIDLVMKLENLDFLQAVKRIIGKNA